MKTAVIAPSMLYLLYPLNGTVEGYSREKFVEDLVDEVNILTRKTVCSAVMEPDPRSARKTSVAASRRVQRECLLTSLKVCITPGIVSSH